jgi:NAD(P)-dependent dehydrogenase (short-subunit alcohol dehydrogenase family)
MKMSMNKIEGVVALVTGSNRGIGRALTETLLERGAAKVYAATRRPDAIADLVQKYGGRVVPVPFDVTDSEAAETVAERAPDVQLLLNNAGVAVGGDLLGPVSTETLRREMEVNLLGTLHVSRAFAPVLRNNAGGALVNVVSIAGLVNFPLFPTYSISKAAVHSLTQALRLQLATNGTQVVGVYPGPVDTDMAAEIPFQKSSPRDVANAILDGVLQGKTTIYPDPMAEQFGAGWESGPIAAELGIAEMVA